MCENAGIEPGDAPNANVRRLLRRAADAIRPGPRPTTEIKETKKEQADGYTED